MKKVCFYVKDLYTPDIKGERLYCPFFRGTSKNESCGTWCAWFDIEIRERDSSAGIAEAKFITCKGTPIGELVEEEGE